MVEFDFAAVGCQLAPGHARLFLEAFLLGLNITSKSQSAKQRKNNHSTKEDGEELESQERFPGEVQHGQTNPGPRKGSGSRCPAGETREAKTVAEMHAVRVLRENIKGSGASARPGQTMGNQGDKLKHVQASFWLPACCPGMQLWPPVWLSSNDTLFAEPDCAIEKQRPDQGIVDSGSTRTDLDLFSSESLPLEDWANS